MGCDDNIPLFRLVGIVTTSVLHYVCVASDNWVEDDDTKWGLYKWCYTYGNYNCTAIWPGDSPGYYEVPRTFSAFNIVGYILLYLTFDDAKGLGYGKKPILLMLSIITFHVITLAVLGAFYEDDDRWDPEGVGLGWCSHLHCVQTGLAFITMLLMIRHYQLHSRNNSSKPKAKAKLTTLTSKAKVEPKPKLELKPKPDSKTDLESGRSGEVSDIVLIRKADNNSDTPEAKLSPPSRRFSLDSWKTKGDHQTDEVKTAGVKLPPLTLPQYDLPAVPTEGAALEAPTTDYVKSSYGDGLAPPRVAVPDANAPGGTSFLKRSVSYFKNYARLAVGLKRKE